MSSPPKNGLTTPTSSPQAQPSPVTEATPLLHPTESLPPLSSRRPDGNNTDAGEEEEETTVLSTTPLSPTRLWLTLSSSYVGVFLGALDSSVIATLAAPIASEFRSLSLLSWLATAYLIANATCQPLSGRLTDVFGRGKGLVVCNALFAAGNLICAVFWIVSLSDVMCGVC